MSHRWHDKNRDSTYELVLLEGVDEHLARFLVAHILSDLIEDKCAEDDEEACRKGRSDVCRLSQALRQILVEVY